MRIRMLICLYLLPAVFAWPAQSFCQSAQESPVKLTLDHAVKIALTNSPDVLSAQARVDRARANVRMRKSGYYPQLTFNGIGKLGLSGATNGLGLLGLPASPFFRNLSDGANVNQNIFDFGQTRHSVKVAEAEVRAVEHNLESVRVRTAERATVAFLKVLSIQHTIQVKEQDLKERQGVERKSQVFFEAGLNSKLDLDLAKLGTSSAELALAQARADENAAWSTLFAALGQPEGGNYQLVEPQIELKIPGTLDSEVKQALTNRPDLLATKAEVEAQEERVKYAQSLRRPSLRAVFTGGYARFTELTAAKLLAGGLGLFAPIYTGGNLEAHVQAEQSGLEALRAEYSFQVFQIHAEVSQSHADVVKALTSAKANEKIASYAKEALRLARTRYDAQLISMVELLAAETAAETSRADYAQAIYDYRTALARLNSAMGLRP